MNECVVTLDVRDDLRNGREPFTRIMQAVAALRADQSLRLLAPLEPVPLLGVMARKGFRHQTRPIDGGDWEIIFERSSEAATPVVETHPPSGCACGGAEIVDVDARGLEPPQPMVKILEALAALAAGAELRAHTDRRPMHLYTQLEDRGYVGATEQQPDGSFITRIRRK